MHTERYNVVTLLAHAVISNGVMLSAGTLLFIKSEIMSSRLHCQSMARLKFFRSNESFQIIRRDPFL